MKAVRCLVLLIIFSGFALGLGRETVIAQESPLVLAFYYAWFDQNTWDSGQTVDLPAVRYTSADPATIERHVSEAQTAGINAFVQSWYGPQEENNQTETNFRVLLNVAQTKGFQAAVDVEVSSPFLPDAAAVSNAISTLMATHIHHPAYLRYQGKPVIFFWREQRFSVEQWAAMREQLDPNHTTFWIAEGVDIAYQAVFDGHHLYSIAWAGSPAAQLAKWGDRVRAYETEHQVDRLWVATAMPGYNDTRLPRADAFAVARRDGAYFRETWQGAVASQPDMIIINSFNEWPEGTHIEPSVSYGNRYLNITRELVTNLSGNPPAAPPPAELPPAPTEEVSQPLLAEPYLTVEARTNVRSGPSTEFDQIRQLPSGEAVAVTGRTEAGDWLQIEEDGWVFLEVVDLSGDIDEIPIVESPAPQITPQTPTPESVATPSPTSEPTEELSGRASIKNGQELGDTLSSSGPDSQASWITSLTGVMVETYAETVENTPPETEIKAEPKATLYIPEGGVNVRSGPGLDFELLGRLDEFISVPVLDLSEDELGLWWQIEYEMEDGEMILGWVSDTVVEFEGSLADFLNEEDTDIEATPISLELLLEGTIRATAPVNIRTEPSDGGLIIGGMYPGDTMEVVSISEDKQWWQVVTPNPEETGWVATEFVTFEEGELPIPLAAALGTVTVTPTPTETATPTLTPTRINFEVPATFGPTATSVYQATAAALVAQRTPDPSFSEDPSPSEEESPFSWSELPWGILILVLVAGFIWYRLSRSRKN